LKLLLDISINISNCIFGI